MDPNFAQHLPGAAYIQKLQFDQPSTDPFAVYDNLTPDEPRQFWLFQFIGGLVIACASLTEKMHLGNVPQIMSGNSQPSSQYSAK